MHPDESRLFVCFRGFSLKMTYSYVTVESHETVLLVPTKHRDSKISSSLRLVNNCELHPKTTPLSLFLTMLNVFNTIGSVI